MNDKDILEFVELQQEINKNDRLMIRNLQKALIEKEEKGQLSPETVKRLKWIKKNLLIR